MRTRSFAGPPLGVGKPPQWRLHAWDRVGRCGPAGRCHSGSARSSTRDGSSAGLAAEGTYSNQTAVEAAVTHAWNMWTMWAESGTPE